VRLAELAHDRGTWPVKLLFGGGENITEDARQIVENVWSAPLLSQLWPRQNRSAPWARSASARMAIHRNDLFFFFETPDTDAEGYGELVYTTLVRDVMPLIRYRSTDLTRLVDDRAPAGCLPSASRKSDRD